ncbi:CRAL-TRIO domain-containing protein [Mycena floridula]|nr:CRAL-TRIO domain-containing protein [Mycena floridula]
MAAPAPAASSYKTPPGHLGNLSPEQQTALDKFKADLIQLGKFNESRMGDSLLLRYLRARKFDVEKAKVMILDTESWRVSFGVEDIMNNFDFKEKEEVDKYYAQYYHKMDKDGRPVYLERLGGLDIKKLYKATTQERLLQRLVYEYGRSFNERLPACSDACGHPVETFCTILDLANVSLTNFYRVKDYVYHAAMMGQNRFPETMGKFYIINAPWTFSAVWAVIRPWLDEVTVSKVDILGSNYKETLLAQIDKENLPKDLGGECDCPGGCSMSDAGPWNYSEAVKEPLTDGDIVHDAKASEKIAANIEPVDVDSEKAPEVANDVAVAPTAVSVA